MTHWVLLRGLTRESAHWGPFADELARALGGAQVTALDLPGTGAHHAGFSPARMDAIVAHCRAALAARGPVALLGLSMGGMVALHWAARHPQDVSGGVLVNSSVGGLSPPWQRMRAARWPALLALAAQWPWRPGEVERGILRLTSSDPDRHAAALQAWRSVRAQRPVSAANALRQLLAAATCRVPAVAWRQPWLVVCSEGDRLVHPRCSQRLAEHGHWPLRLHPCAGHDLPLDDGPWLAATVARWAAEHRLAARP
jgi:pimeloyl-ACP methyl ester carboxylesterase